MSATAAALVKAAILALTDENTRKKIGWVLAAILSPVILLIAFLCALGSGTASHNLSVVELCFYGGKVPSETPDEYRAYIEEMRAGFNLLDGSIENINELTEGEDGLDEIRVKALFYALYFGADNPEANATQGFLDCFVAYEERTSTPDEEDSEEELEESYTVAITYEERTRTVTVEHEDGTITEEEETYTVAVSIEDLEVIYQNIRSTMGVEATEDQRSNAESIYSLIRYGYTGGSSFEGADVPFIGADGFCSPIGENWRSVVTSEFGNRIDPITGQRRGHTGMDLAVPTGTPIRAALPGTVTVSTYNRGGYGYYIMIDHGDGLSTLYGHCSQLLASVGRIVNAGDVVALSGSTGRSTGPHLHFEVRVNGQRTNPRGYLP